MSAEDAAAESPSDNDAVALSSTAATQWPACGDLSEQRRRDYQRPIPTVRISARNGDIIFFGQRQDAFVELDGKFPSALARQGDRKYCSHWHRGHRGQIAQVHRQCLAAHAARIDVGQNEVNPFGQQIHGDHALVDARHGEHGRVIAGPQPQQRVRRKPFAKPGDELLFHAPIVSGTVSADGTRSVPATMCRIHSTASARP